MECGPDSRRATMQWLTNLLEAKEIPPSKEELLAAAEKLKTVVPYNYEAWRLHADLLLNAIHQLETRQLQPDDSVLLLATPLREDQMRHAAEVALRQCAHFADSAEKRIAHVDEANRIRLTTWF
jgi:hypothetical protein